MAELKAGGMAIIIDSCTTEEIGRCITTERLCQPGEIVLTPTVHRARVPSEKCWMVTGNVSAGGTLGGKISHITGWAFYPPDLLMPIDGEDFQHEDERQKELTHG